MDPERAIAYLDSAGAQTCQLVVVIGPLARRAQDDPRARRDLVEICAREFPGHDVVACGGKLDRYMPAAWDHQLAQLGAIWALTGEGGKTETWNEQLAQRFGVVVTGGRPGRDERRTLARMLLRAAAVGIDTYGLDGRGLRCVPELVGVELARRLGRAPTTDDLERIIVRSEQDGREGRWPAYATLVTDAVFGPEGEHAGGQVSGQAVRRGEKTVRRQTRERTPRPGRGKGRRR